MKAVDFKERNIIIAEKQEEYENLPACAQTNGIITYCMELEKDEVKKVLANKTVSITVQNFAAPVQPICVTGHKPVFPVSHQLRTISVANSYDDKNGTATFYWPLKDGELKQLEKTSKLWITTITYGKPLQPINSEI